MLSDKVGVQDLVERCISHGLKYVVISPGSRHAPLSLSFYNHSEVQCYVIPDERAAGYFALGIAQYTRTACALVSTSGTAAMNYGPAIAEAFYQEVSLVVFTADRPQEWIDQGDGQTIRQHNLHLLHSLASFTLNIEDRHPDVQRSNARMMSSAWNAAHGTPNGPVHINIPLREPLYGMSNTIDGLGKPIDRIGVETSLAGKSIENLEKTITAAAKVWLITGMHPPDEELRVEIERFAGRENVLVLTETGSNMSSDAFMGTIDRLLMSLSEDQESELMPELLITFGGNIVSKKVKAYIRKLFKGEHWHIDPAARELDTFQHLSKVIPCTPKQFFKALHTPSGRSDSADTYHNIWMRHHSRNASDFEHFLSEVPWCDLSAYQDVLQHLPDNSILQMGNSSVVRYIQLFDQRPHIKYYGNRGTSGIDGCTSTAAGMAAVSDEIVTLITGDIAFLYDINGLWSQAPREKLRIVLINNGGGSIFKIIDGPSQTNALEEVFESRHSMNAVHLAAHFKLPHKEVKDKASLREGLQWLYMLDEAAILEIDTQRCDNEYWLKEMFKNLK